MKPHPPAQLADSQCQVIAALLEREIDGIVVRTNDAEEARVAKSLDAAAAEQSFAKWNKSKPLQRRKRSCHSF